MKTGLKIFGFVLAAALLAGTAAAGFFLLRRPDVAPPLDVRVEMTPERLARGKYIYTVADCDGCHFERDFTRFGGPVVEGGRGKGVVFPDTLGLPGRIASRNITTDKEMRSFASRLQLSSAPT